MMSLSAAMSLADTLVLAISFYLIFNLSSQASGQFKNLNPLSDP